ncbi:nitrate reductase cytochrome c-type subunit [Propionivibrio dicarboxylicus]|uniref:Periplasmic nitrate reductase, electron transfer subunit n=1 Tax=Propionivibrio dicarboxylicus TaxID=83767 RepID=A0A1G8CXS1_9RHOO|nr:nitrate reductase cytochrome c-type subunit [Propionivibrio dicarboxylicus]SDH50301.1 periplasmic nitrate reductase subunit NapB [Propionivibrio dicarboxylicus]
MNQQNSRFSRAWAFVIGVCVSVLVVGAASAADGPVKLQTLRGVDVSVNDPVGEGTRFGPDTPVLPRDFVQQPPLIPHTIEGYLISKEFNKCMDCHSWARSKEANATKISITHFKTREGAEMSSVSPQRYFCNQCHVSQTDSKPLVGNTFKPGAGLR